MYKSSETPWKYTEVHGVEVWRREYTFVNLRLPLNYGNRLAKYKTIVDEREEVGIINYVMTKCESQTKPKGRLTKQYFTAPLMEVRGNPKSGIQKTNFNLLTILFIIYFTRRYMKQLLVIFSTVYTHRFLFIMFNVNMF